MRRLWYAVVPVMVLAGVLAGCTRVPPVDPGPGTTTPVVSASTPTGSAPVSSTPTPVTPTPTWDANQQGAIDAVQEYLAVWADIGQHLPDADTSRIEDVASYPRSGDDLANWDLWTGKGWHLVGAPRFEVSAVVPSMVDSKGTRYYVHGCYVIEDSYLADATGNPVPTSNRVDRARGRYVVLRTPGGSFVVLDNVKEDGAC